MRTFIERLWDFREDVLPFREILPTGLSKLRGDGIEPDVVFVDADLDRRRVRRLIRAVIECFPNAAICGGGWNLSLGVQQGVMDVVRGWPPLLRQPRQQRQRHLPTALAQQLHAHQPHLRRELTRLDRCQPWWPTLCPSRLWRSTSRRALLGLSLATLSSRAATRRNILPSLLRPAWPPRTWSLPSRTQHGWGTWCSSWSDATTVLVCSSSAEGVAGAWLPLALQLP